ncbi:hypothetical protein HDV02_006059 [Globomyces sp. JEL0801]|nr:hypothetical protein HDV02_006059 [Globomyces sp. JEL0801]
MPGPNKKTGLGRSLIKQRFKTNPNSFINDDGLVKNSHQTDSALESHVNMQSVTEENDLSAFLSSAELAGTDFTAEKLNITVVKSGAIGNTINPFLLTNKQEQAALKLQALHTEDLTIPRRPQWDSTTTAKELQKREKDSFVEWRRSLVFLEEEKGLILTPYERNIEVWRQLWRVIERSELVVQIVDGRHCLFFVSEDLQKYVKEVNKNKVNLLLINKADMMTVAQRIAWGKYFEENNIQYSFFSAYLAKEVIDQEKLQEEQEQNGENEDSTEAQDDATEEEIQDDEVPKSSEEKSDNVDVESGADTKNEETEEELLEVPESARIINASELIELLSKLCPESDHSLKTGKRTIGFVGYPNIGKTKHFQTIHLSDSIVLCDCPGLVFPSFATTKADMVVNGVLPIDQLREHIGPIGLLCQRIPKYYLEAIYGINIKTRNSEGQIIYRAPTAEEFLSAYAIARGYTKSSQGNPDEARAARYILKDYVNGKLLYIHPPPGYDRTDFNKQIYEDEHLLMKQIKKLDIQAIQDKIAATAKNEPVNDVTPLDKDFFQAKTVKARTNGNARTGTSDFTRVNFFPFQEGSNVQERPNKKSHKKERRKKVHAHWTVPE